MVAGVAGTVLLQTAAGTEQVAVYLVFPFLLLEAVSCIFSEKGSSLSVTGLQRSGCRAPGGFPGVEQDFSGGPGYEPGSPVVWILCGVMILVWGYQI